MDIMQLKHEIFKVEDELSKEFEEISDFIFNHPELGDEELASSEYLVKLMKNYGFNVEYPYCGIKTAFRAEMGEESGPAIAFLAEYDALPGLGPNGDPAHACGHNWIAATTAGAAIVLSKIKKYFKGKIVLIGTPAEETVGRKCDMVQKGAFKDIDVVIQMHLENENNLNTKALAMDAIEFEFIGKASHAAACPHEGINALDAVNLTFAGINALRQHVKTDVRIHGIITKGGDAPNIVPEYAACRFYVRANKRSYLNEVTQKVINCAKGAALMTGATLNYKWFENPFDDLIINPVLKEIALKNFELAGIDNFSEKEEEFPGSSDIGNVSHVCPTIYGNIDIGPKVGLHTREFLKYANGPEAYEKLHKVIKAMACTALDVYLSDEILNEIISKHNEFLNSK